MVLLFSDLMGENSGIDIVADREVLLNQILVGPMLTLHNFMNYKTEYNEQ